MISDTHREKEEKEKLDFWEGGGAAAHAAYPCSTLGRVVQHGREADGVSPSPTFWELPPKPRASLSHTLNGFHSCPQKYVMEKHGDLVQESYQETSLKTSCFR